MLMLKCFFFKILSRNTFEKQFEKHHSYWNVNYDRNVIDLLLWDNWLVVLAFLTFISHQIIMAWCGGGWFSYSSFHGQTKYNTDEKRRKEFCRGL